MQKYKKFSYFCKKLQLLITSSLYFGFLIRILNTSFIFSYNVVGGIYEKSGKGVNGVYNQDFNRNTMLIEIGGVDSNLNSVFNSTEIIAKSLYYIFGDLNEKVS